MALISFKRCLFLLALVASGFAGSMAYRAGLSELTGQAIYEKSNRADTGLSTTSVPVAVTRAGSPTQFREATNSRWMGFVICAGISAVAFTFYRKLDDCV